MVSKMFLALGLSLLLSTYWQRRRTGQRSVCRAPDSLPRMRPGTAMYNAEPRPAVFSLGIDIT